MTRIRSRVGPQGTKEAPALDVDALLDDTGVGIIVCCGAGGVGKTTVSAALALRAAERGRKVVVLTIDPARRLAQSMGIEELDNTPRPVPGLRWQPGFAPPTPEAKEGAATEDASKGPKEATATEDASGRPKEATATEDASRGPKEATATEDASRGPKEATATEGVSGGSKGGAAPLLLAMMLDMKRTFDEVVESQASPEKARQILENPFYQALSSSFAGTQEYMAMEKLGQIHRDARVGRPGATYDLIVVDTPPSRSALDFLDAPERLSSFLDGRFIRLLLAPARGPARFMSAGLGMVTAAVSKVVGAQVLRDVQTFVAAFDTLFGGFRVRAQETFRLLQDDSTAFLVVAAPEPDALREAAYFVERLSEDEMPLAGLVVNRAGHRPVGGLSPEEAVAAAERLGREDPDALTAGLLRLYADRSRLAEREASLRVRFAAAHPQVATVVVPALAGDVNDLGDLRRVGILLGGQDDDTAVETAEAD